MSGTGQTERIQPFWLGSDNACRIETLAKIQGDNIPSLIEVPMTITVAVKDGWLQAR
jgi:hypothetical protein